MRTRACLGEDMDGIDAGKGEPARIAQADEGAYPVRRTGNRIINRRCRKRGEREAPTSMATRQLALNREHVLARPRQLRLHVRRTRDRYRRRGAAGRRRAGQRRCALEPRHPCLFGLQFFAQDSLPVIVTLLLHLGADPGKGRGDRKRRPRPAGRGRTKARCTKVACRRFAGRRQDGHPTRIPAFDDRRGRRRSRERDVQDERMPQSQSVLRVIYNALASLRSCRARR